MVCFYQVLRLTAHAGMASLAAELAYTWRLLWEYYDQCTVQFTVRKLKAHLSASDVIVKNG